MSIPAKGSATLAIAAYYLMTRILTEPSIVPAERFRDLYEARKVREASWRCPRPDLDPDEIAAFRDLVLSKISRLTPKRMKQIRREIEDDWGSVVERRIYRALYWLMSQGLIIRVGEPRARDAGYVLSRKARDAGYVLSVLSKKARASANRAE